jgi:hypothetical protein
MDPLLLVTQAYGREEVRTQALHAAWTALAWADGLPLKIVIYSDEPEAFAQLDGRASVRRVTPHEIRAWRGPHNFVHRFKIEMISDAVAANDVERILYFDADVAFKAPLANLVSRIGPWRSVLHVREFDILAHRTRQMRRFRRHMRRLSHANEPLDLAHTMWNAGVIGLDRHEFPLLAEWRDLVDEVYAQWPYWTHEQWALSYLLERATTVAPADDVVLHYWGQKDLALPQVRELVGTLGTCSPGEALEHVLRSPLRLPPPHKRSLLEKQIDKVRKLLGLPKRVR